MEGTAGQREAAGEESDSRVWNQIKKQMIHNTLGDLEWMLQGRSGVCWAWGRADKNKQGLEGMNGKSFSTGSPPLPGITLVSCIWSQI